MKISRVNNKSEFKFGKKTRKYYIRKTDNIDEDKKQAIIVNATFDNLVERWQNERDEMNEVLEEWSPYWNKKDLREPLSDNEYESTQKMITITTNTTNTTNMTIMMITS